MDLDRHLGEIAPPDLPMVRFYTWDRPTISIGCNQRAAKRINSARCAQDGIPVVKRPTGGRELLHGHDLCYCAAIPGVERVSGVDAIAEFGRINDILVSALGKLQVDACWSKLRARSNATKGPCFAQVETGEITVDGKKLIGSAQRVFEKCIIQQGSMPLYRAPIDLVDYLTGDYTISMRDRMALITTHLYEHIDGTIPLVSVVGAFKTAFEQCYGSAAGPAEEPIQHFLRNYNGAMSV